MKQDNLQKVINAMTENHMTSYTSGPIYSSFLFRVNSTLINLVSRHVTFPDGDGVEHTMWEDTIPVEVKEQISNWLGVRNTIIDAINELDGGYPPATIGETYDYLISTATNVNETQLKQQFALEYLRRQKAGEKLHSNIKDYVDDSYTAVMRSNANLVDTRDAVITYLDKAETDKSKDPAALSYNNLPEWFDDMVLSVFEAKFSALYGKKLTMLDRPLSPSTRQAIETEALLMESVADKLKVELKSTRPEIDQNAFLASLGLDLSAI